MSALQKLLHRHEQFPRFVKALFTQLCVLIVHVLRESTPGNSLPEQWDFEVTVNGNTVEAVIWNKRLDDDPEFEEIMVYLDFGTSDHWIFPVNAKVLSWVEDGVRYFSAGHRVSGIKASNFSAKTGIAILKFQGTIGRKYAAFMNHGTIP